MNKKLLILSLLILSSSSLLLPSRRRRKKKPSRQRKKSKKRTNSASRRTRKSELDLRREKKSDIGEQCIKAIAECVIGDKDTGIKMLRSISKKRIVKETMPHTQARIFYTLATTYYEINKGRRALIYALRTLKTLEKCENSLTHENHLTSKDLADMHYIVGLSKRNTVRTVRKSITQEKQKEHLLEALKRYKRIVTKEPENKLISSKIVDVHYHIAIELLLQECTLKEKTEATEGAAEKEMLEEAISELQAESILRLKKISEFEDDRLKPFPLVKKILSLRRLGDIYEDTDLHKAIRYYEKSLNLTKKHATLLKDKRGATEYNELHHDTLYSLIGALGKLQTLLEPREEDIDNENGKGEDESELTRKEKAYFSEWDDGQWLQTSCGSCNIFADKRCSCKNAIYCSEECQKDDWPEHKETCSAQRDEEEGEEEILPKLSGINYCSVCAKPTENVCGRCKQIYYCSPVCQRQDWRRGHKEECPLLAQIEVLDSVE